MTGGRSGLSIVGEERHEPTKCGADQVHFASSDGRVPVRTFRGRAAVITLGCAKNQVDSEVMLGVMQRQGFEIVADLDLADVAVVNTCSFLESAIRESLDAIMDVAERKERGQLRKLVVAGCMVSRFGDELKQSLPEVDAFISTEEVLKVGEAVGSPFGELLEQAARPYFLYDDTMPRCLSTKRHMAYVKIAEGCNRPCKFCIIPKIRGAMRSRSIDSVVREVRGLVQQGVREINLVAQDLTAFGVDRRGQESEADLTALLRALDRDGGVDWIRLLYAYPIGIDAPLLRAIAELPSVVEYLDLPLQHASERVLRAMQRPVGRYAARRITEFIRETAPELALRTTFIVGYPGEREEDVAELERFIAEGHFSSVGVFTYSPEEGTPAATMDGQVPEELKQERRERLMLAQQGALRPRLEGLIGRRIPVLVEGVHEDTDLLLVGRARFQAPEVDGSVIINDLALPGVEEPPAADALTGALVEVEISEVVGYDLVGAVVSIEPQAAARHSDARQAQSTEGVTVTAEEVGAS